MLKKWNKKGLQFIAVAVAGLVLSGCVSMSAIHKNPTEMRADSSIKRSSKIVNRSFSQVASTYQRMAPRCLNVELDYRTTNVKYGDNQDYIFTSKVRRSSNKVTLTLQKYIEGTEYAMKTGEMPKGGAYVLVVDAVPYGKNQTKITTYERTMFFAPLEFRNAIDGWGTGEFIGCPSFD